MRPTHGRKLSIPAGRPGPRNAVKLPTARPPGAALEKLLPIAQGDGDGDAHRSDAGIAN